VPPQPFFSRLKPARKQEKFWPIFREAQTELGIKDEIPKVFMVGPREEMIVCPNLKRDTMLRDYYEYKFAQDKVLFEWHPIKYRGEDTIVHFVFIGERGTGKLIRNMGRAMLRQPARDIGTILHTMNKRHEMMLRQKNLAKLKKEKKKG